MVLRRVVLRKAVHLPVVTVVLRKAATVVHKLAVHKLAVHKAAATAVLRRVALRRAATAVLHKAATAHSSLLRLVAMVAACLEAAHPWSQPAVVARLGKRAIR